MSGTWQAQYAAASETRLHEHVALRRVGMIEIVRIDREAALGALSRSIVDTLVQHTMRLAAATDVRVVVFTGTGRAFVAGADINEYQNVTQRDFDDYQRLSRRMFDGIAALPQPTICAANGYALGGGFELALACDFILASEKARFGLPEIKLGLLPGGGGTQRLARLIGRMRAKELILTGRMMQADEALAAGVVLSLAAPDALLNQALQLAAELAVRAPLALREGKRIIDDGDDTPLHAGLTMEQRALGALFASDDAREGIEAFIDKREAVFLGK